MPNYINTDALVDGQQADAADVKAPLETLDQELFDLAGQTPIQELVARTVLSSDATQINIPITNTDFHMLRLVMQLRTDRSSDRDDVYMRFNDDTTGSNYYTLLNAASNGGSMAALNRKGYPGLYADQVSAASSPTGFYGLIDLTIYDYTEAGRVKFAMWQNFVLVGSNSFQTRHAGGAWIDTSNAISNIKILPVNGTNIVAGSSYQVFGVGVKS